MLLSITQIRIIIFKALERVTRTRQHLITGKSATVYSTST